MNTLDIVKLESIYKTVKETSLFGKWVHYKDISSPLTKLEPHLEVKIAGYSENKVPIHTIQIGNGPKKVLVWTQMHGNESTGTKALFDFLNCFIATKEKVFNEILNNCTILCIPMLNPDGALLYTRENINGIDLNRDAITKTATESKLLRGILDNFQPDFCFNLHDQRTIFGIGGTKNPASISFLAPSEEETRAITKGRIKTMNVIVAMNSLLQKVIPNHVGRYTDEFYPTATGDNFQKLGYSTILIEAGHYKDDYDREEVRKFNFFALLQGIYHIATENDFTSNYKAYFNIPNNQELFFDVIEKKEDLTISKGFLYKNKIIDGQLVSELELQKEGDLSNFLAHSIKILK